MAISIGMGKGKGEDAQAAGVSAARDALHELVNRSPEGGIVFASSSFDANKVHEGIRSVLPDVPLVGATTGGEITKDGLLKEHSVVLVLFASDHAVQFVSGESLDMHQGERAAGISFGQSIAAKIPMKKLSLILAFPDGLSGSGSEFLRGLSMQTEKSIPIAGALASDDLQFSVTHEYGSSRVFSGGVSGLGISDGCAIGVGVDHGWRTIGLPMVATKTEGALLIELDGSPAIGIYEKYFGELAKELREGVLSKLGITYPLGLRISGSKDVIIRTPLSIDEEGAILCGGEVPQGSAIRLMIASPEAVISAAGKAAAEAKAGLGGKPPRFGLIFSSITRKKLLGDRISAEISAVQDVLGRIPIAGMYTYGELSPVSLAEQTRHVSVIQNQSITVIAFGD